jgi:hypothetical protein
MSMDQNDRNFLCSALGYATVLMRSDTLPEEEHVAHAIGAAAAIEGFSEDRLRISAVLNRMAAAIADLVREQGGCLPQDLNARGFTPDEVARHWNMAKALAAVHTELNPLEG